MKRCPRRAFGTGRSAMKESPDATLPRKSSLYASNSTAPKESESQRFVDAYYVGAYLF